STKQHQNPQHTRGEGSQQGKDVPPPARCFPGSSCHGMGRRTSCVQLTAVHAALGALILVLVVILTGECHQASPRTWMRSPSTALLPRAMGQPRGALHHALNADVLLLAPHLFNSSFSVCWRAPIPPFPGFAHVCPNAWVGFQGKCCYFLKGENDWNSSREHCNAHGASLATIGSAEEMVRWGHEPKALGKAPGWGGTAAHYLHRGSFPILLPLGHRFELRGGGRCAYLNGDRISSYLCHLHKHWVCSRADHYVLWKQKAHPQ
uniref:C-type lectin domain-containing protein n=1 Tax=Gallus gallus TaxID=9031 RepID=A0A8V0X6J6_CHICK